MKVVSVIGTRPQIIKAVLVSQEIRKNDKEILINTGQHYDSNLWGNFIEELGLPNPDYDLGIGSGTHGYQTGMMIMEIEKVLLNETPDLTLVYGDTNSTIAGAISSAKLKIPVAHVEAGLREYDMTIPEEINKVITDRLSSVLFAPTATAVKNLKKEGIATNVFMVGDVSIGLTRIIIEKCMNNKQILKKFGVASKDYYLTTIHREKNTSSKKNMTNILQALCSLDAPVVFPIHPRTKKVLNTFKLLKIKENVLLIDPVGYIDMITLIMNAKKIITDSGGVIKESYFLKVPCITVDETTEWVETIEDGWNIITGPDKKAIQRAVKIEHPVKRHRPIFGDGCAHENIYKILRENFGRKKK